MENYKKKYEEALERGSRLWESDSITREVYEYMFPELKESEEEKIRKWIVDELKDSLHTIEALYSGDYDNRDNDDIIREGYLRKALAWLEKQGKQNPTWSEEDERIKYNLIKYCGLCRSMSCCDRNRVDEAITWLKSLKERYTWKPSDEQINTLEQWLKDNQYKGDARYCYPIFDSLYQDLKKLREE